MRLSRDRVGETSTARQEADTRALAQARGFEVVEVFSDVDLSAYKAGVVRPAYEKMLAAARAGDLDAVVVWKVDRLARSLREFVRVTEMLDKYGVALVSVNESLDTSSPWAGPCCRSSASSPSSRNAFARPKAACPDKHPVGLADGTPLRDGWDAGDLEFRRSVLAAVVEKITVAPTTVRGRSSFDPERVDVTWKA